MSSSASDSSTPNYNKGYNAASQHHHHRQVTGEAAIKSSATQASHAYSFSAKKSSYGLALLVSMLCMLCSGTFDTIASKWMNKQQLHTCEDWSNPDCDSQNFEAPTWQTFTMYMGDSWIAKQKGGKRAMDFPSSGSENKPNCPFYWWIIPAILDMIGTTLINWSVIFTYASTSQMLRNFNIVIAAFLTIFYLRRALRVNHWGGVLLVTVGMIFTSVAALLHPDDDSNYDSSKQWVGILCALGGTALSSFQFVFEEKLFRKYRMAPLKAVGIEGVAGFTITGIMLLIFQYTGAESTKVTAYQIKQSGTLVGLNVAYVLSISIFNASGLFVTKLASGLLRAIMFAARSVTIWIVELALQWNDFDAWNFVGLLILTLGCLLYNDALPSRCSAAYDRLMHKKVPCCGWVNTDATESSITGCDDDDGLDDAAAHDKHSETAVMLAAPEDKV